ncbi:MAG TPA: TssQ family T6SS-associated lipoprotein [Burkholderiales bacterium]
MMRLLIVLAAGAALAGCGTEPMRELEALFNPNRGEAALAVGLKQYEDGRYAESLKNLQTAIGQGLSDGDRVNAHKHVAFIHCAANRERACRDEFRRALRVNPAMELAPAEAGHPIWGPIFRSVKAGR